MKYCPICDTHYEDAVEVCKQDGATLRQTGDKQDPFIGKVIKGRYNVLKKLGEGGMGTVYLADQVSIGRKIALKVLHGQYARDEEFVRRFRTEARLAASLNHRNIMTVYDFDQADDGSLFIVMEYVEGKNLKEVIQQGPVRVETAVRLGIQIAEGLGAAHRAGVIHRDIKPENIMVTGNGDAIKLMDFGIARLRDTGETRLTRSGVIMGTPAYMSPEQAEGAEGADPVTEKTDIYAFGIVLYEMLSGSVPFRASTPGGVLVKHLQEMPLPLRKRREELPLALELLVAKALEKKPEQRQESMDEVARGLEKIDKMSKVEPLLTEPAPAPVQQPKRRMRLLVGGALAALIAVVTVVIGKEFFWDIPGSRTPASIASIVVLAGKNELEIGENLPLQARVRYTDGKEVEQVEGLQWRSSDPRVAAVNDGKVQAVAPGEVQIIGRLGDKESPSLALSVKGPITPPQPQVKIISLAVRTDRPWLNVSQRTTIKAKAIYSDGTERELADGIVYQSSDSSVLSVDAQGQAEALKEGKAFVTAQYKDVNAEPLPIMVRAKIIQPPPAKRVQEAPFVPRKNPRDVVSDYIDSEKQRRRK